MPPKSANKKSNNVTWYQCEACNIHITSKEQQRHDKVCPLDDEKLKVNSSLEYIKNGCLFTQSIEQRTFVIDEIKDLKERQQNQLIFISEGAMRLANLHIGQQVVIEAINKETIIPLVRSIWPIAERFLTTVFVSEEDFTLYWSSLKDINWKIQALENFTTTIARNVRLCVKSIENIESLNDIQLNDVKRLLKLELKNLIYTKNSLIFMDFFNRSLELNILDWEPHQDADSNDLEVIFDNLSLEHEQCKFFKITLSTNIDVVNETMQTIDEIDETRTSEARYEITKNDIGGLNKQLALVEELMDYALGFKKIPNGLKITRGVLLYGSTGCGKTLTCQALTNAVKHREDTKTLIININTSELFSRFLGETEKNLNTYFEKAYKHYPQPTLIIIEDVHNICPKNDTTEVVTRLSVAFMSMLDRLGNESCQEAKRTFLIATTTQIDTINSSIRRCGRLETEIEYSPPTPNERNDIIKCLLKRIKHNINDIEIDEISHITHGFVGADLANLISSAMLKAFKSERHILEIADIRSSLTHIKPSAMREVLIDNPNVRWDDIGGQHQLKLQLKQAIEWPLLYPDKFEKLGIKPPRGILMFGPPGCSKTMIAKALATESQLNFLSIKGPELFSMWVGESERAVREVFRKARQVAPAIVFFDEIDAISSERSDGSGSSGSSVKERVLTQLLTEMDGVETLENVTIVAATNRPDMIDKALLRPGRIDRIVYVGLPDAESRKEIFKIKLRSMPLADDVDIDKLVERTAHYSGAEIQAVCHEAALRTLEISFESEKIAWEQFEYALDVVKPRTSIELLQLYDDYLQRN